MRQYVIDELRTEDYEKIKAYLDEHFGPPEMSGLYWLPLSPEMYSGSQKEHLDCQPYFVAVDLERTKLACELLIRTKKSLKCACIAYATRDQRDWIIDVIDTMFEKNGIIF